MEISLASVSLLVLVAVLTTWAWRVFNWLWLKPKRLEKSLREQGFAGNSYRLLFGDMKETVQMLKEANSKPINLSDDIIPRILPFVDETIRRYGKNCFVWYGPTPRVNIMNPEHIKEVFLKHYDYPKPESNPLVRLLAYGLASLEGEVWGQRRKIINPAFHQEKLKHMVPAFRLSCIDMINQWKKLTAEEGSCEVNVWPYLMALTGDAISRTAFGSSYEEGRRIFQLQKEQAELMMKLIRSVYIPGWRFMPTKLNKRVKEIDREVKYLLTGIINKREKAMKDGEVANDDLLGLLMESNMKEINESNGKKNVGMTVEEVIGECKLFYFAGQETTSVLLVWTIVLLCKYQEWQARAREEVLQVFGKEKPDIDGLSHLKIVTMILHEVLRLYPPVTLLTRTIHKKMKLGNLLLPPGVQLSLPTIFIHQDKEFWGEDAKEFKPERFSEGVSKATRNQVSFFPFGWGPRICIGQQFAMVEAKIALAMILQHFSFELSTSYAHAPVTVITTHPQHGAPIILHKI